MRQKIILLFGLKRILLSLLFFIHTSCEKPTEPTTTQPFHVPVDFSSIQEAIDEAENGDTILVHPGTYREKINFNGKNIVVCSMFVTTGDTSYISTTIIRDGDGSVMIFDNGEDSTAVLSGFTIKNGSGEYIPVLGHFGGGIYCSSSSPRLSNLLITKNFTEVGGGIALFYSSPILENVTVYGNHALEVGGIYCRDSNPRLMNVTIRGNGSWTTSSKCGGISLIKSDPYMENVTIKDNGYGYGGGGIYMSGSSLTLINGKIINNGTDSGEGGGIQCNDSNIKLKNVIIANNRYNISGGGISCNNSTLTLENVTLTNNEGREYGGGILCANFSNITMMNSILWNNYFGEIFFNDTSCSIKVSYSDIQGGEEGIISNYNGTVDWRDGNIDEDPLFMDVENGDFHLQQGSPCIDAGNPAPEYNDPDGSRNDMGAYGGQNGNW